MLEQLERYCFPRTVAEAVRLLRRRPRGSAVALCGAMTWVKPRLVRAKIAVDISRLGLSYIRVETKRVRIGSTTTLEDIARSRVLARVACGIISQGALGMSSPLQRQVANLEALLANGINNQDILVALLALDAKVKLRGRVARTVALEEIWGDGGIPKVGSNLVVEVVVPKPWGRVGAALERVAIVPSDVSILSAVAVLRLVRGQVAVARVAVGGGLPRPVRLREVEARIEGRKPSERLFRRAAERVGEMIEPTSDVRASADYRCTVAPVLVRRALAAAHRMLGRG